MIMPFGKHKGKDIGDVPSDYLLWLARDCNNKAIAIVADEEYQYREKNRCHIWE